MAEITHSYTTDANGDPSGVEFECHHHGQMAVQMKCTLPEKDVPVGVFPITLPVEVPITAPDACSAPRRFEPRP